MFRRSNEGRLYAYNSKYGFVLHQGSADIDLQVIAYKNAKDLG